MTSLNLSAFRSMCQMQVIYMIGWKPDASQPKACRRGSADVSLKELNKLQ